MKSEIDAKRTMKQFVYNPTPTKVICGSGTLSQIRNAVVDLQCRRALVIVTEGQIDQGQKVMSLLGDIGISL